MRVEVVAYDPRWKAGAEAEAGQIHAALGDIIFAIHHIGSTAIPGIFAKPILDFLLEVKGLTRLDDRIPSMEGLGYEPMGEYGIPGRRFFRKLGAGGKRTHHVHAFETGSPELGRHLAFRDYMIAHPEAALQYSALKRNLAQKYPDDIDAYMDGKDIFIKEHEAKAIEWRRRDV
jgi:GrpB-like predicted nucleotidyltransferase (UPF0157 family)